MGNEEMRRVAKIRLDPQQIAGLLELPDGFEVVAVQGSFDPVAIEIIVKGDALPESPVNSEAPFSTGWIKIEENGVRRLEWTWPTEKNVWGIIR